MIPFIVCEKESKADRKLYNVLAYFEHDFLLADRNSGEFILVEVDAFLKNFMFMGLRDEDVE